MLPSGKSNISLGCQQDRYFPNGLWEAAAPLFLPWDREQRCPAAFQRGMKQEQRVGRGKGQQAAASLSAGTGAEMLAQVWGAAPSGGQVVLESPCSWGKQSQTHMLWALIWVGTVPIADNFSPWLFPTAGFGRGSRRGGGIAVTEMHENLLHSQEASEEPRKLFPLNS